MAAVGGGGGGGDDGGWGNNPHLENELRRGKSKADVRFESRGNVKAAKIESLAQAIVGVVPTVDAAPLPQVSIGYGHQRANSGVASRDWMRYYVPPPHDTWRHMHWAEEGENKGRFFLSAAPMQNEDDTPLMQLASLDAKRVLTVEMAPMDSALDHGSVWGPDPWGRGVEDQMDVTADLAVRSYGIKSMTDYWLG